MKKEKIDILKYIRLSVVGLIGLALLVLPNWYIYHTMPLQNAWLIMLIFSLSYLFLSIYIFCLISLVLGLIISVPSVIVVGSVFAVAIIFSLLKNIVYFIIDLFKSKKKKAS